VSGARIGPEALGARIVGRGNSATLAIQARSARLRAEGHRFYRLRLGQPPFPVPPMVVEALRRGPTT
jgi:aspartate aminotransferase